MMLSPLPDTPGRGRSRFSKILPEPPRAASQPRKPLSPASNSLNSPLPPLPKNSMAATITRRPVGNVQPAVKNWETSISPDISSSYSASPALSRSGFSDSGSSNAKDSLLSGFGSEARSPPLPTKDDQIQQGTTNAPSTPEHKVASTRPNFTPSPPRTEIWRRRSVKSDRSITFPELKLEKSNGSTASPPRGQEPPSEKQNPRSVAGARRTIPRRPAPPQPDSLMGNKLAKIKSNRFGAEAEGSSKKDVSKVSIHQLPPFQRLPTPEFLKQDEQQLGAAVSPVSPFTPPRDLPPPPLPQKSESRSNPTKPFTSSVSGSESTIRPSETPSGPTLDGAYSRNPDEAPAIVPELPLRSSQSYKAGITARILTPQASPTEAGPPVPPHESTHSRSASGFHSNSYSSTHFRSGSTNHQTLPIASADGVWPAPPLELVHFECYQSHKYMRSSKNNFCPVACMICEKMDAEMRWRCTWCCLSACASCMKALSTTPGKDLGTCLDGLAK